MPTLLSNTILTFPADSFWKFSRPLAVLPMALVQYLRVKISMERLSNFLGEPEVDDEVSSFKNGSDTIRREGTDQTLVEEDSVAPIKNKTKTEGEKIGIINGYFLWSEPAAPKEESKGDSPKPWWRRKFWTKGERFTAAPVPVPVSQPPPADDVIPTGSLTEEVEVVDAPIITNSASASVEATSTKVERQFELTDINILFPPGELSLVTGPTASGKTALLRALLGEMYTVPPPSGTSAPTAATEIYLPKRPWVLDSSTGLRNYISYAAQTPWLEHLSIKDNILFGSLYEEERYQAVLECCALKPDLATFEDGDKTEIGERGVSLSGGQKARYVG